jgi:hypothetical protein
VQEMMQRDFCDTAASIDGQGNLRV